MRILLIEDDRRLAKRIQRVLVEERHLVEVVHDGKSALLQASGDFDCLILDILLPGMNGIAVCRWLREHAITTPILLLTALGEIQDKVRGLDTGADDYLTKPFAFDELLARLRALERRKTTTLQVITHLQLGSLSLNLLTREVQVYDVPIVLTVREFALLEYLLRHPHQALTRTQILATVSSIPRNGSTKGQRTCSQDSPTRGRCKRCWQQECPICVTSRFTACIFVLRRCLCLTVQGSLSVPSRPMSLWRDVRANWNACWCCWWAAPWA